MHKRQGKKESKEIKYEKLKKTNKRHPIQQIVSSLPQLAISCAILFCAISIYDAKLKDVGGILFLVSLVAGAAVCLIFVLLQLGGAQYKNWQQEPKTRKYIQIASINIIISFIGLDIAMWSIFGILTPIVVISGFVFVMSILIILTALF